jgi:hypothetical protein
MGAVTHPTAAVDVLLVAFHRLTIARGEGLIEGTVDSSVRRLMCVLPRESMNSIVLVSSL